MNYYYIMLIICNVIHLDYGYGYEAPPAPVSATRGRGTY